MFVQLFIFLIIFAALFGIVTSFFLAFYVFKQKDSGKKAHEISSIVHKGANTYLKRQFKAIIPTVLVLSLGLLGLFFNNPARLAIPLAFITGAAISGLAGVYGMNIATKANSKVLSAASIGFYPAMDLGLKAGLATGLMGVGLGLFGITLIYYYYGVLSADVLVGFGFGASLVALFMRIGGGIYTKSADIGADLVGKLEEGIPEDDPRNAAVIADLVGDNVGDCAGMTADILESFVATLVAAIILGVSLFGLKGAYFPLAVSALGIFTSAIGVFLIKRIKGDKVNSGIYALIKTFAVSSVVSILGFFYLSFLLTGSFALATTTSLGLVLSLVIFLITDYATGNHKPVKDIADKGNVGAATVILSGMVYGFTSATWVALSAAMTILISYFLFPDIYQTVYGIAMAGLGMLTAAGLVIAIDAYGPIVDNAQGISEMSGEKVKIQETLSKLDSIGNTTKATTKSYDIASAFIASISLFGAFMVSASITQINIAKPIVFVGFIIGAAVPFFFSAQTIKAVSNGAYKVINEVRRQFKNKPGIIKGTSKPDYERVVDITTKSALNSLIPPVALAILVPIIVGLTLKEEALGGLLAGVIATGLLMAVFMTNAGGAWDNAKKLIERGLYGGKGTDAHKATVVGDTVGDPLKDTTGPSLNVLLKVMNLIAVLIVPLIISSKVFGVTHFIILLVSIFSLIYFVYRSQTSTV